MKYYYEIGAVRWRRHDGKRDVRSTPRQSGWELIASFENTHPITGNPLKQSEWWIRETYKGFA